MSADTLWDNQSILNMDPFILVSTLNTKLRNEFESLPALCERYNLDQSALLKKLGDFGYEYIGEINQFRMP